MARVVLHSILRPGQEKIYEQKHRRIPEDLVATFDAVGIHDWTIWRSGLDLFHLVECDDFVAAMRVVDQDPANERWQAFIGPCVDRFVTVGEGSEGMLVPQVWSLEQQRNSRIDT